MRIPVFFDNVIALIRNDEKCETCGAGENSGRNPHGITDVYLTDGRVNSSVFTPETMKRRYYSLFSARGGK